MKKNFIIISLIMLFTFLFVPFTLAAVVDATWTANNADYFEINNGMSAEFEYRAIALNPEGRYSVYLTDANNNVIKYWVNNQPSTNNGADGYITITPQDYQNYGLYTVHIYANDRYGPDHWTIALQVYPNTNILTVSATAAPTSGYAPLRVYFSAAVSGGQGPYAYEWHFGDGSTTGTITNAITHTYNTVGTFNPYVVVSDSLGNTATSNIDPITVMTPVLNIISIQGFAKVVQGNNQTFQVLVESNDIPAGDVDVKVYLTDGQMIGSCVTDELSGGCTVYTQMNDLGIFTAYATATKPGYINDDDTFPQFTFEVIQKQYDILNLGTYNDQNFLNPDSIFYRGEALYVKFQVYDPINHEFVSDDIVTAASLISMPGGNAYLSRMYFENDWYYYKLDIIPLTHDFLGDSNVFAFAFNFSGNVGGQAQTSLTILNNPPTFDTLPEIDLLVGETVSVNIFNYGNDLEDLDNLLWEIINSPDFVDVEWNFFPVPELLITGNSEGTGDILLRISDLDNDFSEANLRVRVRDVINNNTLSLHCDVNPRNGQAPLNVLFTATASGGTGDYLYSYVFGDGRFINSRRNTQQYSYNTAGSYNPFIIVTDNSGNTAQDNCPVIFVTDVSENETLNADAGGPYNGFVNEQLLFDGSASTGDIVEYLWDFGDGTNARTTSPQMYHTYSMIGRYDVVMSIFDTSGRIDSASTRAIVIERTTPPEIEDPDEKDDRDAGILINSIIIYGNKGEFISKNDDITVMVNAESEHERFDDSRLRIEIQDLGIYATSGLFDLRTQGKTYTATLPVYNLKPGIYYMKIIIGNDDMRRIKYRDIIVK